MTGAGLVRTPSLLPSPSRPKPQLEPHEYTVPSANNAYEAVLLAATATAPAGRVTFSGVVEPASAVQSTPWPSWP